MRYRVILGLCLAACSATALAADKGVYVGASISQSTIDTDADLFGFDFQDDDTAYKLVAGIRPFDALSFEVNYIDFGSIGFEEQAADGFRGELETQAIDIQALGYIGGPLIEVFGKIGVVYWDAESVLQGGIAGIDIRDSDNGTDLMFGAGLQAQFGSLAARLEYESFEVSDADKAELWSLGVTWTFF